MLLFLTCLLRAPMPSISTFSSSFYEHQLALFRFTFNFDILLLIYMARVLSFSLDLKLLEYRNRIALLSCLCLLQSLVAHQALTELIELKEKNRF